MQRPSSPVTTPISLKISVSSIFHKFNLRSIFSKIICLPAKPVIVFQPGSAHFEIISAVGAYISSLASLVFGTSANFRKFPKTSQCFRALPSASERVQTHPGRSEQVQTRLRSYENFEKLAKTSRACRRCFVTLTSRKFQFIQVSTGHELIISRQIFI